MQKLSMDVFMSVLLYWIVKSRNSNFKNVRCCGNGFGCKSLNAGL